MAGAFESFELCGDLKKACRAAYAFGVGNRGRLGEEDLMMPAGLNRFACLKQLRSARLQFGIGLGRN
jgi:hypothetical protein